jgi:glycosyltransferase EpsD
VEVDIVPGKVLFCATIDLHLMAFHLPYFRWFKEQGWEVHAAAYGDLELPFVDKKYSIPFRRSPFSMKNYQAYKQLEAIIDLHQFEIIHCHTPVGGVITRLAARNARKHGAKVFYTAHGFHFFKGAPFLNWVVYYPIEKILAQLTDCLITINMEDFQLAQNHHFKAGSIKHIHGVGVDTNLFFPVSPSEKHVLRAAHGYKDDAFLMFYAAEFNRNKNQQFLIKSLAMLKQKLPNATLLLAGDGPLMEECQKLAVDLDLEGMVRFLGYRKDIDELLKISDLAVASSLREGLPVNIMEAMACGLPITAVENRGHKELVQHGKNGWIIKQEQTEEMAERIKGMSQDKELRIKFGNASRKFVEERYSLARVLEETGKIYMPYMEGLGEYKWAVH